MAVEGQGSERQFNENQTVERVLGEKANRLPQELVWRTAWKESIQQACPRELYHSLTIQPKEECDCPRILGNGPEFSPLLLSVQRHIAGSANTRESTF